MFLVMAPTFPTSWYLQQPWPLSDSAHLLTHLTHAVRAAPEDPLQVSRVLKCTAGAKLRHPVAQNLQAIPPAMLWVRLL